MMISQASKCAGHARSAGRPKKKEQKDFKPMKTLNECPLQKEMQRRCNCTSSCPHYRVTKGQDSLVAKLPKPHPLFCEFGNTFIPPLLVRQLSFKFYTLLGKKQ
eukprot:34947-Pelagomonas_calceolata.AAC.6